MASLEILKYPDPVLREVSKDVTEFDDALHSFIKDLEDTMYSANGIGLASPQVGVLKRIIVIDISRDGTDRYDLINPKILSRTGKATSEEGCLSIPDYRDTIPRASDVVVGALDRYGKEVEIHASGLLAYCLQHEIDHLNGVLFIDHLSRLKRELFKRWLKKQQSGVGAPSGGNISSSKDF